MSCSGARKGNIYQVQACSLRHACCPLLPQASADELQLDMGSLEALFSLVEAARREGPGREAWRARLEGRAQEEVRLVEHKRAHNIGIVISGGRWAERASAWISDCGRFTVAMSLMLASVICATIMLVTRSNASALSA